jgi:predicted 3-demethylubiquinone-9 3-methyltransferase (glyoxalase superfamily)
MQKITPYLWFDNAAEEAAQFYTGLFPDSKILFIDRYGPAGADVSGQTEGSVMEVQFELAGQAFAALNGGTYYTFSPAVSLFVYCRTQAEINNLWTQLAEGGQVLMPLEPMPFAPLFGWVQDRFGLSWQLILAEPLTDQKIAPCLMFTGKQHGKALEAIKQYTSLFADSGIINLERYKAGEDAPEGTVKQAIFKLAGQVFIAMDSHYDHGFDFNQAISFLVNCQSQDEIDYFWSAFLDGGSAQQCGWLSDAYGMIWQIAPTELITLMQTGSAAQKEAIMKAILDMEKIELAPILDAYRTS